MNFLGMGPGELVLVLIIAVIVLGPGKLPEVARALGKTMREFRSISDGFQSELRKELDAASEPVKEDLKSVKSTLDVTAESAREQAKAVSTTIKSIPDDSFTEEYQKAQGGGGQTGDKEPETAEQVSEAAPDAPETPVQDDTLPVEYAPVASAKEEPDKME